MTSATPLRWCGLLTMLVAVLVLVLGILPSLLLPTSEPVLHWVQDAHWPVLSVLTFVVMALLALVLIALYAVQIRETGVLGLLGFVLMFLGLLLFVSFQFDMAFVWPVLSAEAADLVSYGGPMFNHPMFSAVHSVMGPLYTLGALVFGIATARGRVFPRRTAVLFTIGMVLSAGLLFPPLLIRMVGAPLAAIGLGHMGWRLWAHDTQPGAAI